MTFVEGIADLVKDGDQPITVCPVMAEIDCERVEDIAEDARIAEHFHTQRVWRNIDICVEETLAAPRLQAASLTNSVILVMKAEDRKPIVSKEPHGGIDQGKLVEIQKQ